MPWPMPRRQMPLHREPRGSQGCRRGEHRARRESPHRRAMGEKNGRTLGPSAGGGSASKPEKPTIAAGARRSPRCSASMAPWLKPASTSRSGGSPSRASSASRNSSRYGARPWPRRLSFHADRCGRWETIDSRMARPAPGPARWGATKAAPGIILCQCGARPIRSLPSAP